MKLTSASDFRRRTRQESAGASWLSVRHKFALSKTMLVSGVAYSVPEVGEF